MKKFFAILAIAASLLTLFVGCGAEANRAEVTTVPPTSVITGEEVLENLEELLEPIDDQLTMTPPERLSSSLLVYVTDSLTGARYRISIGCTDTGAVESVIMGALQGSRTELNFALLSCYLYESLELPEMDADDFYAHFNLLTTKPQGQLTTDGWFLDIHTGAGGLFFLAAIEE